MTCNGDNIIYSDEFIIQVWYLYQVHGFGMEIIILDQMLSGKDRLSMSIKDHNDFWSADQGPFNWPHDSS
jgi:hypothetical protein